MNYTLVDIRGEKFRWLEPEISRFVQAMESEAEALRASARLETLPNLRNRLMVEPAVYTAACDRALRHLGVDPIRARQATADLGWDVYRRMLLRFPFNTPGAPGYAVESRVENGDILTRFTHYPPQTYVRRLSEETGDADALESFRQSWCLYDWPGAGLIAGDGLRGHYRRPHTLSDGDSVCDICRAAQAYIKRDATFDDLPPVCTR